MSKCLIEYGKIAKWVLGWSNQIAHRENSRFQFTHHLLLSIMKCRSGIAWPILNSMGVRFEALAALKALKPQISCEMATGLILPLSPRARRAMNHAQNYAACRNAHVVTSADLLAGLISTIDCSAFVALRILDIDVIHLEVLIRSANHQEEE